MANYYFTSEYLWVEDDICEVQMKLTNPLPFELKVSNMRLLTSGVVFESIPETIILAPDSPTTVNLHGTPKEVGELQILGYSTHTLGVKSNCRLKNMPTPHKFPASYTIEVIPSLPTITIETIVAPSGNAHLSSVENVGSTTNISLFNGESTDCSIRITNTSNVSIEHLELAIQVRLKFYFLLFAVFTAIVFIKCKNCKYIDSSISLRTSDVTILFEPRS